MQAVAYLHTQLTRMKSFPRPWYLAMWRVVMGASVVAADRETERTDLPARRDVLPLRTRFVLQAPKAADIALDVLF